MFELQLIHVLKVPKFLDNNDKLVNFVESWLGKPLCELRSALFAGSHGVNLVLV